MDLPIAPSPWKIIVSKGKRELYNNVVDAYKKHNCNAIIVGTDADVEGNGIYYLLEKKAGWSNVETLRFFPLDQTDTGLYKAFMSMTDFHTNHRDVTMTQSFLLRSQYDWMIGMNMTIGATVKIGSLLRIGRVKAPTLKLIYDNCKAIDEFVPKTTYRVMNWYEDGFSGILINDDKKEVEFEDKGKASEFLKKVKAPSGTVKSCEKKLTKKKAPKLYNLSDLQVEAGGKFGYSPSKTLEVVQSLYEQHKLLSYPRTDGRHISTEKTKDIPRILKAIHSVSELKDYVEEIGKADLIRVHKDKNYVNDAAVAKSSHDALIPTDTVPNFETLSAEEQKIYLLVAKRLLAIYYPELEEYKTTLIVDVNGYDFKSTGSSVKEPGWQKVLSREKTKENDIPLYKEGTSIGISDTVIKDKTTVPPKRFTEATLIKAMTNISSYMTDEEKKKIIKEENGLGTQSSRANIIKELRKTGYFDTKKNAIYITELGKQYIENLEGFDIINPEMTADMELHIKHVKEGSEDYRETQRILAQHAMAMVKQLDTIETKTKSSAPAEVTELKCPKCSGKLMRKDWGYYCENKNKTCDFFLSKKLLTQIIPDEQMVKILSGQESDPIHGLKGKYGSFTAKLSMGEDGRLKWNTK